MTIFFSDIAGFTSVAEEMSPDALVALLGGYLDGMTDVIGSAGGTVDKFIGDGIMAFWGAPEVVEDHAARACEAALGCQRELERMQREGSAEMKRLATRIGLATGEVLVGNIGTPERLNYTVMGDVVNLASRLEGLNKQYGTRVMASEETVRAANGRVVARAIDVVAVKGKARGVRVYELMARASEGDARAARVGALSEEALEAYLGRDFARAEARWAAVLDELPGDRAASLMRDRAREYGAHPPPAEWNGVYVAHEK
jgi:adenylate cyclase